MFLWQHFQKNNDAGEAAFLKFLLEMTNKNDVLSNFQLFILKEKQLLCALNF